MKLLLKIAGSLKFLFLINIIVFNYLRNIEFHKRYSTSWGSLTIEIEFPWYFYLLIVFIIASFIFNSIAVNVLAFMSYTKTSMYLLQKTISRIIYLLEIPLLLAAIAAIKNNYDDAFHRQKINFFEKSVEYFSPTTEPSNYTDILKLEVLNYTLPLLSAIIILASFWKFRATCLNNLKSQI